MPDQGRLHKGGREGKKKQKQKLGGRSGRKKIPSVDRQVRILSALLGLFCKKKIVSCLPIPRVKYSAAGSIRACLEIKLHLDRKCWKIEIAINGTRVFFFFFFNQRPGELVVVMMMVMLAWCWFGLYW